MNNAAVNKGLQVSEFLFSIVLGTCLEVDLLELMVILSLMF